MAARRSARGERKRSYNFEGIWAGLPTPWNSDFSLDEKSLAANIQTMVKAGVHGIYLLGSSGEFYALDHGEFKAVIDVLVEEAGGSNIPLAAVCASPSTRETIRMLEYLSERGCDAAQVVLPYWMELTERELLKFFRDIAGAVPDLPLIHYNVPRAKRFLLGPDYVRICQLAPNLVASKFTFVAGHFGDLVDAMLLNPEIKFLVAENLLVSAIQLGAHGSCSSIVYTNSSYMLKTYALARAHEWERALEMQRKITLFLNGVDQFLQSLGEGGIDPVADKGLGVATGGLVGHQRTRAPYIGWSDATMRKLRAWVKKNFPEFLADA